MQSPIVFDLGDTLESQDVLRTRKLYQCPICPHSSPRSIGEVNVHIKRKHLKIKSRCPHCDMLVPYKSVRRSHYRYCKKDPEMMSKDILKCNICDNYSTKLEHHMKKHIRVMHTRERSHLCDKCDMRSDMDQSFHFILPSG